MGGPAWFCRSFLLYFRGNHVVGTADKGKTGVDGKNEAAKTELALSLQHSWFYPDQIGSPPGTLIGQAR